jgi:hypothetical protein
MVVVPMTAPTQQLRFFCPLTCGTRPDAEELGRQAVVWADRFGLVGPDQKRRLERIDIGLLTSMVMPEGRAVPTQLAADFTAWLFAFDDCYADEQKGEQTTELAALLSRLARVLEAPAYEPAAEVVIGLPYVVALHDLCVRLAGVASSSQVVRWREAMRAYFMATLWEANNRAHDVVPDLDSYAVLRVHSGAMPPSILLLDVADGYEVPNETMMRPDVQALMDMTCILVGWDNDLISHHKESARVGDKQNVLDVIIQQDQCTADQALSRAMAIRDRMMCRYLRLRDQILLNSSSELARYVNSLGYWVRGNIQWGQQSSRYASIDGLSAAHSAEWAAEPIDDSPNPVSIPAIAWWWAA